MAVFFNIIIFILTDIEYISFTRTVMNKKVSVSSFLKWALIVLIGGIIVSTSLSPGNYLILIGQAVTTLLVVYCFFNVSIPEIFKIWLIAFPMLLMMKYVLYMTLSRYFFVEYVIEILLSVIIITVIWIYHFVSRKKKRKNDRDFMFFGNSWIFISFELFVLLAMIIIFTHSKIGLESRNEPKVMIVFLSTICIIVVNILLFYNNNVRYNYKFKNENLKQYISDQKKYYELLLNKEEETKRFRHDVISELTEIKRLIKVNDMAAAECFINEMEADLSEIGNTLFSVGNETIDIMLNSILVPRKQNIKIKVAGVLGEINSVSNRDLCIIVSNLLKNALEAVDLMHSYKKIISIEVSRGNNNFLIHIENTYCKESFNDSKTIPHTTKKDCKNHGYGLKNVKNTVDRYNGSLRLGTTDDTFFVEVIMPL